MIVPPRIYLLIGVFAGILTYLINLLFGPDLIRWLLRIQAEANASGQDFLGTLVIEPLLFILRNDIAGSLGVALLWPLALVWLFLVLCLLLVIAGVEVASDIEEQTDAGRALLALL